MSDNGTATHAASQTDEVAAYVDLVRGALGDLSAEEIEDLTSGMEADLGELLTERGGTLEASLGTPDAYATELRQAAGLGQRVAPVAVRRLDVGGWARDARRDAATRVARRPWLAATLQFVMTLRPAWWVARGMVASYTVLAFFNLAYTPSLLPTTPAMVVLAVPAIVGSVLLGQWCQRRGAARTGTAGSPGILGSSEPAASAAWPVVRVLVGLGNVVALVVFVAGAGLTAAPRVSYLDHNPGYVPPQGLSLGGAPVDNVYLYDAQGHRLTDVRLFGSDGQSLVLDRKEDVGTGVTFPGRGDVYGQWWTNVFPRAYTVNGDPYAVNPLADPGSPQYQGQEQWKPPPSIAPLQPGATISTSPGPTSTAPTSTGSASTAPTTGSTTTAVSPSSPTSLATSPASSPVTG